MLEFGGSANWADEVSDLPKAPMAKTADYTAKPRMDRPMGDRQDRGDRHERSDRPDRVSVPFPTVPPFVAYVGNLSFEVSERDINTLFGEEGVISVRLITDYDGKPKGFGYVEFKDALSLKAAVDLSDEQFLGRRIRVNVADGQKSVAREDKTSGNWRSAGGDRPSGRDDFRSGRDDRQSGRDDEREGRPMPRFEVESTNWRTNRTAAPLVDSKPAWGADRPHREDRQDRREPREQREDKPREERRPYRAEVEVSNWRTTARPLPPVEPTQEIKVRPALSERTPLPVQEKPKVVQKPKSNPFGAAVPIDETEVLKKVEEKLMAEHEELKRHALEKQDSKDSGISEEVKKSRKVDSEAAPRKKETSKFENQDSRKKESKFEKEDSRKPKEEGSWRKERKDKVIVEEPRKGRHQVGEAAPGGWRKLGGEQDKTVSAIKARQQGPPKTDSQVKVANSFDALVIDEASS